MSLEKLAISWRLVGVFGDLMDIPWNITDIFRTFIGHIAGQFVGYTENEVL